MFNTHHFIYTASRTHKEKTMAKAIEVNCETGEVTERDLTAEELQAQADAQVQAEAERVAKEAAQVKKLADKEAIAKKLGLTSEELAKLFA
jgi:hypothetical protein